LISLNYEEDDLMKKIDARGLECPKPVIKTKNGLEKNKELEVIVDNNVAAQNVKKLAIKMGAKVALVKESDDLYKLIITNFSQKNHKRKKDFNNNVIFVKSDLLGGGEEKLGEILIRGFISTLIDIEPFPDKIIFMNAGVKLPCNNQEIITSLERLENKGVKILSCGTCLDFYGLQDDLQVGSISNMYEIVDSLNKGEILTI